MVSGAFWRSFTLIETAKYAGVTIREDVGTNNGEDSIRMALSRLLQFDDSPRIPSRDAEGCRVGVRWLPQVILPNFQERANMLQNLLFWAMVAQGADIGTTGIALNRGCTELTYPIKSPLNIALIKGGASITFAFMYGQSKAERPKLTKGLAWVLVGSGAAAAAWNATQIPKCRK